MSDAADGAPGGRAPDTGIAPRVPRNPVYTLFVTNQRIRGLLASALRDAPIRSDEYGVYSAVYMAGTLTLTQLARSTGMPLTTVADYVRSMVERGHLERRPNPDDRRSALLRLTPAGTETVNVVMPAFTQAVRTLLDELEMTREALQAALDDMAAAAERATKRLLAEEPPRPPEVNDR